MTDWRPSGQIEATFAILFWMNLMQLPMNLAGSDPLFVTRLDASMTLPSIAIAVAGLSVHLCTAEAFRYGDRIPLVPFNQLIIIYCRKYLHCITSMS